MGQNQGYVHRFEIDGGHAVHIYKGSLVDVQADVLVSSDDNSLSAGGGVSRALARAAGPDVFAERRKIAERDRPTLGDVVRTSAGGLSCRYLYHAITIDFDAGEYMDEAALRKLVDNLFTAAAEDRITSIGIPALGTGVAGFDLERAAPIIIEELLDRLSDSGVARVILALVGDDAEKLFYEELVRRNSERLSVKALRRRELQASESPAPARPDDVCGLPDQPNRGAPAEMVEQFPSLIDEARLKSLEAMAPQQPRLVTGLAELIIRHASPDDIEQELLSRPSCYGFRGSEKQRLMEFLYLSENNLRCALGPSLFRSKELRVMAEELEVDIGLERDPDQLIDAILRSLGFNLLTLPIGLSNHIEDLNRLITAAAKTDVDERHLEATALAGGKLLEQVLKDILRIYGYVFWGPEYEIEFVSRKLIQKSRTGSVAGLTVGQSRDGVLALQRAVSKEVSLQANLRTLGRQGNNLLPKQLGAARGPHVIEPTDCEKALQEIIDMRNSSAHARDPESSQRAHSHREVHERLVNLSCFLLGCRAEGIYPDVFRYEGMFENRNGERFVHFLDERGGERRVRTDEKIDARRHYYCFATNNPVHLFPTLVPKL